MKQTAVEFLQESLSIHFSFEQKMQFEGLFQQAKEMEKQQQGYSEEEVMDIFHNFSMHLPLHYEFLVKEQFKKK